MLCCREDRSYSGRVRLCIKAKSSPKLIFSVSFYFDLPGGQINDPLSGKHFFSSVLPATPPSLSQTLEGLFELTQRPSRALDSPRALLPELQRDKDTVRRSLWQSCDAMVWRMSDI